MNQNYNIKRRKLILPEYGRHLQEMIDYLVSIKDRDLRNEQARVVVEIMGNINPVLRDAVDFKHKLWDHMFIMSDFKLDVDSPYPKPTMEAFDHKPNTLPYPSGKFFRKHYGKNISNMIAAIKNHPQAEEKTAIAATIAKYMRAKSYEFNQEYPNNDVICKDIREMSDNLIIIDESAFNNTRIDHKLPQTSNRQKRTFSQNPSKNNPRQTKQGGKIHFSKSSNK